MTRFCLLASIVRLLFISGGALQLAHEFIEEARQRAQASSKIPEEYVDPISQELMSDPVITADGHTYERAGIERWLAEHDTSPLTNIVLGM